MNVSDLNFATDNSPLYLNAVASCRFYICNFKDEDLFMDEMLPKISENAEVDEAVKSFVKHNRSFPPGFYVRFLYGANGAEVSANDSKQIGLSIISDNSNEWNIHPMNSVKSGKYWMIIPNKDVKIKSHQCLAFEIDNIKTGSALGVAPLIIKAIGQSGDEHDVVLEIPKVDLIRIKSFETDSIGYFENEQVRLLWNISCLDEKYDVYLDDAKIDSALEEITLPFKEKYTLKVRHQLIDCQVSKVISPKRAKVKSFEIQRSNLQFFTLKWVTENVDYCIIDGIQLRENCEDYEMKAIEDREITLKAVNRIIGKESLRIQEKKLTYKKPAYQTVEQHSIKIKGNSEEKSLIDIYWDEKHEYSLPREKRLPLGGETNKNTIRVETECSIALCGINMETEEQPIATDVGLVSIELAEGTSNTLKSRDSAGISVGTGIIISGTGKLTVSGGNQAAAIGSPNRSKCGEITINGGVIIATGASDGAGIGSSVWGECGGITINGGIITAKSPNNAAGIGSGPYGSCGLITINGGTITASAYSSSSGIGDSSTAGSRGIVINGGVITSSGKYGVSGRTIITGGSVNATMGSIPINSTEQELYKVIIEASSSFSDPGLSILSNDTSTYKAELNSENKAYIWLPKGNHIMTYNKSKTIQITVSGNDDNIVKIC